MLDVIRELDSATFSDSKHPVMLVRKIPYSRFTLRLLCFQDRLRNALSADNHNGTDGDSPERRGTEVLEEGSQELADWLFYSSSY